MKSDEYIPALSYDALTPFYDTVVRWTTREKLFKTALVEQARIEAHHRVLDLACGTGTLTILLKRNAPQSEIVGIDGDPKILKLAREKARAGNFDIRFDEGMSFDLPYADETFDRVVSSLFFHHLTRKNKLKTLLQIERRVLRRRLGLARQFSDETRVAFYPASRRRGNDRRQFQRTFTRINRRSGF
jgi:ubiquinone/menaquinone biosynthesis C-methylase UbiE